MLPRDAQCQRSMLEAWKLAQRCCGMLHACIEIAYGPTRTGRQSRADFLPGPAISISTCVQLTDALQLRTSCRPMETGFHFVSGVSCSCRHGRCHMDKGNGMRLEHSGSLLQQIRGLSSSLAGRFAAGRCTTARELRAQDFSKCQQYWTRSVLSNIMKSTLWPARAI